MRIVLLSDSFLPNLGGAEVVVHHLARVWGGQGHQVVVLNNFSDSLPEPGLPYLVRRFPVLRGSTRLGYHRQPFLAYALFHLSGLLRAYRPDFISAHFAYPAGLWLKALDCRVPYLITLHGKDLTTFDWGYRKQFALDHLLSETLHAASGVVALSGFARKAILELNVSPDSIHDIPNGVELERFRAPAPMNLREMLGLPSSSRLVVSVGRNHPAKAYEVGLQAFRQVAAEQPHAHYVVFGKEVESLGGLVRSLGLEGRVQLRPPVFGETLVAAYQQADVYFSSSRSEVLSLVILEALASGTPVVATRISGNEDLIVEGECGLLVRSEDPTSMASGLLKLLGNDQERARLREGARLRAQAFGWPVIAQRYLSALPAVACRLNAGSDRGGLRG